MSKKIKYYSLKNILKKKSVYNIIIGERSNGKTYSCLEKTVKDFMKDRVSQFAYVRRWQEDIKQKRARQVFNGLNSNHSIENLTDNEFTLVYYNNGCFYLANKDETGKIIYNEDDCFGYIFCLSDMEHDKSTTYTNVKTVIFDEFLTRGLYLQDEFVTFMNLLSTIIRRRTDVTIFMLANTVNKYAPYFKEMGITHIDNMKQGTIDVYTYGDKGLTVSVEYCESLEESKENNFYFAFNNPKLSMITGGAWEMNIYPHLPIKYKPKDILFTYFIEFNDKTYQCEIIDKEDNFFTYIHEKTTPIKYLDEDMIYTFDYVPKINYNRNILKPMNNLQKRIAWFFQNERVFYQDNNVGDSIHNYLKNCGKLV